MASGERERERERDLEREREREREYQLFLTLVCAVKHVPELHTLGQLMGLVHRGNEGGFGVLTVQLSMLNINVKEVT